jgi:hypothetical protein
VLWGLVGGRTAGAACWKLHPSYLIAVGNAEHRERRAPTESRGALITDLPAAVEHEGAQRREPREKPQPGVGQQLAVGKIERLEAG